jgi:hypothetical protein
MIVGAAQVTLTIALAIAVVLLALSNGHLSGAIHTEDINNCHSGNTTRLAEARIDRGILALPALSHPAGLTPAAAHAQAGAVTTLRHDITAAYALRDCAAVYSGKGTAKGHGPG